MKYLLFLVLSTSLLTAQMPETADSVYWSSKFCDTAEGFEEHLTQWTWNGNVGDCIQPSEQFANAFYDEKTGHVLLYLLDTYECCCQVASTPGSIGAWTFFYESPCQEYLDNIGFVYDDPEYINWTSLEENIKLDGIYIDMFGRQYTSPPKGLSVMDKEKFYRFN